MSGRVDRSAVIVMVAGAAWFIGRVSAERRFGFLEVRRHTTDRRMLAPPPGDRRLTVVVPAFNEAGRIGGTVMRLREELASIGSVPCPEAGWRRDAASEPEPVSPDRVGGGPDGLEIIVVDDGSTDTTAAEAERAGADQVVRLAANGGKGAAVRAGVLAARGRTVAFTDADLSYSPDNLRVLLAKVEEGWDVVVGSRRHTETTTLVRARALREIGGRAINLLTHAVLLGQYRDTQCGLKAFRSDVARLIFSHCHIDGFAFDVEVLHLVERYQLSLTEVPVRVENFERSSVRVVHDGLALVRDLGLVLRHARRGDYDLDAHELLQVDRHPHPSTVARSGTL